METAETHATSTPTVTPHDHGHHNPHLAHHFDTPEQQMVSAKLGMWVFLGTEVLMFGGLFCAYSVYRALHPDVFEFAANTYLDTTLGAINTVILISSSLTMAWGVRAAQLNQNKLLINCLILTLLGAVGFLCVKTIEYHNKYKEGVMIGLYNKYNNDYQGDDSMMKMPIPDMASGTSVDPSLAIPDGNAGTPNEAKIKPHFAINSAVTPTVLGIVEQKHKLTPEEHEALEKSRFAKLTPADRQRVNIFFSCYFLMTGLHGVHVLVGMGLMTWLLIRSTRREFSSEYFTPVDLVGLYWHLVDLIWIFLFPLLYLIH